MSVDLPATQWQDNSGLIEFGSSGVNYIVDSSVNNLVDTATNDIIDTGVTATLLPSTVWEELDNV